MIATADGYSGWPSPVTADGWPISGIPVTADGFVTAFTGGGGSGGGGGGGAHGGGGHGQDGGGFHKRRLKRPPFKRLDDILKNLGTPEVYEELSVTDKRDEAATIVRAHAKSEAAVPQRAAVDWNALANDAKATGALMALWHRHQIDMDDEDFWRLEGGE